MGFLSLLERLVTLGVAVALPLLVTVCLLTRPVGRFLLATWTYNGDKFAVVCV